jgi:hypothetical protein
MRSDIATYINPPLANGSMVEFAIPSVAFMLNKNRAPKIALSADRKLSQRALFFV